MRRRRQAVPDALSQGEAIDALAETIQCSPCCFVLLCGLPGCGKTSLAEATYVLRPWISIVSVDDIRWELYGQHANPAEMGPPCRSEACRRIMSRTASNQWATIVDATALTRAIRGQFLRAAGHGVFSVAAACMTDFELCLKRRPHIDRRTMAAMARQYRLPDKSEGFDSVIYWRSED